MTTFHPKYGTLLNSREVSDLTGFTLNQLRYFRQNPEKSPFPLLKKGTTTFYREADIDLYLETHGVAGDEYIVPESAKAAPLLNPTFEAGSKKDHDAMSKILTRNAWSKWTETLTQHGGLPHEEAYQFLLDETVRLYELKHGENLREIHPGQSMDFWLRKNDPLRFWEGRTYATRSLARKLYGWNVTDLDIINTPIGDNPPAKID